MSYASVMPSEDSADQPSFVATLRGHVDRVYAIAWSADSKMLVSGSQDTTVKVSCRRPVAASDLFTDMEH